MALLALVRHGQTDWNAEMRVQGLSDIPLNDEGRKQARQLAEQFSLDLNLKWHGLYSSPLIRARDTAEVLAQALALQVITVPELVERNYGKGEGLTWNEIQLSWGEAIPGRESIAEIAIRVLPKFLDFVIKNPDQNKIFVSHGSTLRVILNVLTDYNYPPSGVTLPNAKPNLVNFDGTFFQMQDFPRVPVKDIFDYLDQLKDQ